jgi:uroporphyrinogen decarboxylase
MNSRERILAVMNHETTDRVPTDIWATPEVLNNLKKHFGHNTDIYEVLHIDGMATIGAEYIGPLLYSNLENEVVDYWGIRTRKVEYSTGFYDEIIHNPLLNAIKNEDLEKYSWPKADMFNYSKMRNLAKMVYDKQVVMCGYMAIFFQHNKLRGLRNSLLDPLVRPEFTRNLLNRIFNFLYEYHRRMFDTCEGLIDVTQVTDDFGTQNGGMISLKVFREFYKPYMEKFVDLAHSFELKVFHHDDGSIRSFIPDLVDMGIEILNPLQWSCPGMDLEGLKRDFGRALCFHGGVDNQRILPFGTTQEVRNEVRHCINALASDETGYILAPCHNIQTVSPIENIIAMYDEAWKYGRF